MVAVFAVKNSLEFFASSTGPVELNVLILKPPCDVANIAVLPHRFKKHLIATGAVLKVPSADVLVFERCTIEHAGSGNVASISLQLLGDVVSIIGDPLGVQPYRPQPTSCILMTMGADP